MSELISCIVPVHNGERFLGEALDSIQGQTYSPIEVIVVDDGSTDGTPVLAQRRTGIRYIRQVQAGPAAARNSGLRTASGAFIAFLDADDLWHPEKLSRQTARFAARPELDVSVCAIQNFWEPELEEEARRLATHRAAAPVIGYISGTVLARRAAFDRVGLLDEHEPHSDFARWFLRGRDAGIIVEELHETLVQRRLHNGNRSRQMAGNSRERFLQLAKEQVARKRRDAK